MEEIFQIDVDNEFLGIRAMDLSEQDTQYEIWKRGTLEFTLVYIINKDNPGWEEIGRDKSGSLIQPFIDRIGEKIDAHYE